MTVYLRVVEPQAELKPCDFEEDGDRLPGSAHQAEDIYDDGASLSDGDYPGTPISYQEWATQRRPFKLPPGLPRAPASPSLALTSSSQRTCSGANCEADDLDDECDAWYERNVASGMFTNWVSNEPPVACPAVASSDDDLDADCDDWFRRNVAAGNFSSWNELPAAPTAADPAPLPELAAATSVAELEPAAGTLVSQTEAAAPNALWLGAACGDGTIGPPSEGNAPRRAGASGLRCKLASSGGPDDDDSTPSSPMGSDCRATSDDCSRGSSRSCSVLSLHSWDTQGSGSEDLEDLDSEQWEAIRAPTCGAASAARGECTDAAEPQAVVVSAPVRLADCARWERDMECVLAASAAASECGGGWLLAGLEADALHSWLEPHMAALASVVVSEALFKADGCESATVVGRGL